MGKVMLKDLTNVIPNYQQIKIKEYIEYIDFENGSSENYVRAFKE